MLKYEEKTIFSHFAKSDERLTAAEIHELVGLDKSDEDINVVGYISKVLPGGYFDLKVNFQVKESNRLDIQIEYTPSNIPGVTALNQRIILFYLPVEYKLSQISARYPSQTSRSKKIK